MWVRFGWVGSSHVRAVFLAHAVIEDVVRAMNICNDCVILFVCSISGILIKLNSGTITDHSQSTNTCLHFKSVLVLEDPSRSRYSLPVGGVKPKSEQKI